MKRRIEPAAAPAELCAEPVQMNAGPVDAPMWPVHSALWFQPELVPGAPDWSGLAIERRNRLPVFGFARSGVMPVSCADGAALLCANSVTVIRPEIPTSDLAPLGWDARALCRKEGGK